MRINRLMLFMLLLGYCHIGCGQEQVLVDTLNVQVYFRQGYSILEFDYRDNAKRLAAFVDSVRTLQGSASCRVKTFRIVGTASPEGVSVLNKRLSASDGLESAITNYNHSEQSRCISATFLF